MQIKNILTWENDDKIVSFVLKDGFDLTLSNLSDVQIWEKKSPFVRKGEKTYKCFPHTAEIEPLCGD